MADTLQDNFSGLIRDGMMRKALLEILTRRGLKPADLANAAAHRHICGAGTVESWLAGETQIGVNRAEQLVAMTGGRLEVIYSDEGGEGDE